MDARNFQGKEKSARQKVKEFIKKYFVIIPVVHAVRLICAAQIYPVDIVNMVRGRHRNILADDEGLLPLPTPCTRVAVIALFPHESSIPFTVNLMKGFAENGFFVLGVSTRPLTQDVKDRLLPFCHRLIQRFNIGYDFGSYQQGIRWVKAQPSMKDVDTLAIANDSLFYPASISETIRSLLAKDGDWLGLFENFQIHYHVQSFFEVFRGAVLRSRAFNGFWATYWPFSFRVHAIHKGEVGLTSTLVNAGYAATIEYAAEAIRARFLRVAQDHGADPGFRDLVKSSKLMGRGIFPFRDDSVFQDYEKLAADIEEIAKKYSVTHSLGLLCHFLFHAPIKCDLCYRGQASVEMVLTTAQGFRVEEIQAIAKHLKHKGVLDIQKRPSWKKLKWMVGVI